MKIPYTYSRVKFNNIISRLAAWLRTSRYQKVNKKDAQVHVESILIVLRINKLAECEVHAFF